MFRRAHRTDPSHYRIIERLGGGGEPLLLTNDEGEKYRRGCDLTRRGRGETKCFGRLSGIHSLVDAFPGVNSFSPEVGQV